MGVSAYTDKKWDLIVVGGGMTGVAAAVSARRLGLSVLILEKAGFLGGAAGTCLTDRMHADYPLLPVRLPQGCVVELMADKPLFLPASMLQGLSGHSLLCSFTDEASSRQAAILQYYRALLDGKNPTLPDIAGNRGRFLDGVQ